MEIGTQWRDGRVYAGPKYGDVSEDEYNELLQSGALGRGQQTVEMFGETLVDHAKNITPDKVKDVVTGGGHLLRDFANSQVGKVAGKAWEFSGLETQVKQTMQILDAPATGISWASRKLDPTERGIGKAPLQVAEAFVPGVGPAKKVAKKGLKYSDEVIDALTINNQLKPALAGVTIENTTPKLLRDAALDKLPSSATPLQIASNMQSPGWQGSVRTLLKEKNSNQIKNILKKPYHKELSKKYQYFSMDNLAQDKGGWLSTLIGKADRIKSDLTDYMNLSRRGISKGRLATEQRKGYDRFTNNPLFEEKNIYDNPIRQKVAETFNTVLGKEWHHIFGNKEAGEFMLAQVGQDPYIAVNMIHHLKRLDLPTGGTASNIALMNKALHRKKGGFHSWYKKIGGEAKGKKKGVLQIDDYGQAISEAILEGKTSIDEYFSIIESYAKFNKYQRTKLKTEFGAEVVGEMGPVMKFIEGA